MLHNYHTHTIRCNHAKGADREYVEAAIQRGLKTLGFSDHATFFPGFDAIASYRMGEDSMYEYAESIRSLQKEYKNDIRILCGFELEYYPEYHKEKMQFLNKIHPDYLLLGQHFIGSENQGVSSASQPKEDFALVAYVTQVLAAIATGDFLYVAHPDIVGYNFSKDLMQKEYRRLCVGAKRMNVPLEINLLGIRENRHYPNDYFYKIAAEVGNEVILGIDAHSPESLLDLKAEKIAMQMVNKLGLRVVDKLL